MKYIIKDDKEIYQKVRKMSNDELICAVTCPEYGADKLELYRNTGAVFFHPTDDETLKKRVKDVNENRDLPALLAIDVEAGAGFLESRTKIPSMWACGCTNSEETAYKLGEITAVESTKFGLQWGFGPCVDILGNTDNPVILNRCPGNDPELVCKIGKAVMQGMQDNGMIAAAKHFPGDGYDSYDPHLTLSVNPLSFEEWKNSFGMIYTELINAGVKSIMPGHISLPSYDDIDPETGVCRPATLSKKLLTNLLKNELGFEGIIVTDAVNMGGFCGYMERTKACATFLECGGDMLLFVQPTEKFLAEMNKLIDENYLKRETLIDRAYRVLCFAKEHRCCAKHLQYDKEEYQKVADEITEAGIVVERNRKNVIPYSINANTKILYNIISAQGKTDFDDSMLHELGNITKYVDVIEDVGPDNTGRKIMENDYDLIICSVTIKTGYGIGTTRLSGVVARNMMGGWQKLGTPAVFITNSHSFKHECVVIADTIINTHGYVPNTAKYVVKKITGK